MRLIIDIPDDDLDAIKYLKTKGWASRHELLILNGISLDEELHREKEQAYYLGYEDGRKSEWTAVAGKRG